MPLQAILIDHDGTLVDSEPLHFAMWQRLLAVPTELSRHQDFSQARAVLGGLGEAVDWIAQHAGAGRG